jgi:hypothetical protein
MIRPRYVPNEDATEVLAMPTGPTGPKTYAVYASDLPATAKTTSRLMNEAYREGYWQAQRDIQAALGVKP